MIVEGDDDDEDDGDDTYGPTCSTIVSSDLWPCSTASSVTPDSCVIGLVLARNLLLCVFLFFFLVPTCLLLLNLQARGLGAEIVTENHTKAQFVIEMTQPLLSIAVKHGPNLSFCCLHSVVYGLFFTYLKLRKKTKLMLTVRARQSPSFSRPQ